MKATIIPADGFVSVNGEGYTGLDISSIPAHIHAIQWYEDSGTVETKDSRGKIVETFDIFSFAEYQSVLPIWEAASQQAKEAAAALEAAKQAELLDLLGPAEPPSDADLAGVYVQQ